ncbi:hypothetical protein TNIN_24921 [Trichonephila inaurata madagascariensis]|uniref:Uncharacterized protein n=1 Tax=Trichonephila inaurata madagascariensis TaxID=2747483 RepID=A0A8X6XK28_9ARAC|nr:hypothetical protein TNIN_24921 [Trichonephila inaurata madagascariensis]
MGPLFSGIPHKISTGNRKDPGYSAHTPTTTKTEQGLLTNMDLPTSPPLSTSKRAAETSPCQQRQFQKAYIRRLKIVYKEKENTITRSSAATLYTSKKTHPTSSNGRNSWNSEPI